MIFSARLPKRQFENDDKILKSFARVSLNVSKYNLDNQDN